MTPLEPPLPWAGNNPQTFEFINRANEASRKRRLQDTRLRPNDGQWKLTDEEWNVVEKIVYSRSPVKGQSRERRRGAVDGIITKLGTGMPWAGIERISSNYAASSTVYEEAKPKGRIEKMIEFLATSRAREN